LVWNVTLMLLLRRKQAKRGGATKYYPEKGNDVWNVPFLVGRGVEGRVQIESECILYSSRVVNLEVAIEHMFSTEITCISNIVIHEVKLDAHNASIELGRLQSFSSMLKCRQWG